ncbi:MAG: hypothetical protein R3B53_02485 [Candidatus Paceibacterota bacterium]
MSFQQTQKYIAGLFVALLLIMFGSTVSSAHAAYITNEQVEAQKKEVLLQVVQVLQQDVKLLQMILIQKLEARVAYLQTLADNK